MLQSAGLIAAPPGVQTAQSQNQALAKRAQRQNQNVPPQVKTAIADSVNASNSPTADDKKGGYHEEGGIWGHDDLG
jgi:hypothetical protein